MIVSLLPNRLGRDFVVGDIHGCYSELETLLNHVQFDGTQDRLIAVGDLIDRGAESLRCIALLDAPWFYCVRGNHENTLLECNNTTEPRKKCELETRCREQGGTWFFSLTEQEKQAIYEKLEPLPYVLMLNAGIHSYCVLHAEIPPELTHLEEFHNLLLAGEQSVLNACLNGRRRHRNQHQHPVNGVDFILCGHTPVTIKNRQKGNCLYLDFGASHPMALASLAIIELGINRLTLSKNGKIINPS